MALQPLFSLPHLHSRTTLSLLMVPFYQWCLSPSPCPSSSRSESCSWNGERNAWPQEHLSHALSSDSSNATRRSPSLKSTQPLPLHTHKRLSKPLGSGAHLPLQFSLTSCLLLSSHSSLSFFYIFVYSKSSSWKVSHLFHWQNLNLPSK